jgi:hypothetical protein
VVRGRDDRGQFSHDDLRWRQCPGAGPGRRGPGGRTGC